MREMPSRILITPRPSRVPMIDRTIAARAISQAIMCSGSYMLSCARSIVSSVSPLWLCSRIPILLPCLTSVWDTKKPPQVMHAMAHDSGLCRESHGSRGNRYCSMGFKDAGGDKQKKSAPDNFRSNVTTNAIQLGEERCVLQLKPARRSGPARFAKIEVLITGGRLQEGRRRRYRSGGRPNVCLAEAA